MFDPEHPTQEQIDAVVDVLNNADEIARASGYIMTKLLMRAMLRATPGLESAACDDRDWARGDVQ